MFQLGWGIIILNYLFWAEDFDEKVNKPLDRVQEQGSRQQDQRIDGEQEPFLFVGLQPEYYQPEVQAKLNMIILR